MHWRVNATFYILVLLFDIFYHFLCNKFLFWQFMWSTLYCITVGKRLCWTLWFDFASRFRKLLYVTTFRRNLGTHLSSTLLQHACLTVTRSISLRLGERWRPSHLSLWRRYYILYRYIPEWERAIDNAISQIDKSFQREYRNISSFTRKCIFAFLDSKVYILWNFTHYICTYLLNIICAYLYISKNM